MKTDRIDLGIELKAVYIEKLEELHNLIINVFELIEYKTQKQLNVSRNLNLENFEKLHEDNQEVIHEEIHECNEMYRQEEIHEKIHEDNQMDKFEEIREANQEDNHKDDVEDEFEK